MPGLHPGTPLAGRPNGSGPAGADTGRKVGVRSGDGFPVFRILKTICLSKEYI